MIFSMKIFTRIFAPGPSPQPSPKGRGGSCKPKPLGIYPPSLRERVGVRVLAPASHGFTLIETFVAITILVMAMVGPLAIASQSATFAAFTRDQVTANFLAQDAVEYVRWIRDSNQLSGRDWLAGLDNCVSIAGDKACFFDSTWTDPWSAHPVQSCTSGCSVMNCKVVNGFCSGAYNYDASPGTDGANLPSHFTRTVSITKSASPSDCSTGNGCEISLVVKVGWKTGTLDHSVTVKENMMRWAGS